MSTEDRRREGDEPLDELNAEAFLDALAKSDPAFAEGSAIYDLVNNVAGSLKDMRRQAKLTQAQLAEKLGVSQGWISQIESGLPDHAPSLETVARFALACGFVAQMSFTPEGSAGASAHEPQYQFGAASAASFAPTANEAAPLKAKYGYGHGS